MPVETLLRVSEVLSRIALKVGKFGSFFILPLVFFTMWDVVIRKLGGGQIWLIENLGYFGSWFESTKLQEWEWHWHTVLFTLVLGYCYVNNRHVRVDLIRENLPFRAQAWIEFLGCSFFLIPFCGVVGYFAFEYAYLAWVVGEISASLVGLPYRWIIKSVLVAGLLVAGIAGLAVWLQSLAVLIGPKELRFNLMTLDWPEEQDRKRLLRMEQKAERIAMDTAAKDTAAKKKAAKGRTG